jgi:hypothetical protein
MLVTVFLNIQTLVPVLSQFKPLYGRFLLCKSHFNTFLLPRLGLPRNIAHILFRRPPKQLIFIDVITAIWRTDLNVITRCSVPHKNVRSSGSQIVQKISRDEEGDKQIT